MNVGLIPPHKQDCNPDSNPEFSHRVNAKSSLTHYALLTHICVKALLFGRNVLAFDLEEDDNTCKIIFPSSDEKLGYESDAGGNESSKVEM